MKNSKMLAVSALAVLGLLCLNACSEDKTSATRPENLGEIPNFNDSVGETASSADSFPGFPDENGLNPIPENPESSSSEIVPEVLEGLSSCAVAEIPLSSATEAELPQSSSESLILLSSSSETVELSSSSEETVVNRTPAFKEDYRDECPIGNIPTSINNAKLPDPFTTLAGSRISTKDEWKCRREEIGAMYEKIMYGDKPRNPEKVEG
ncbi:MAG: hypothetical protein MJY98_11185, partial [Fibrobacter sp.]|nr:hypothetical protein [Fibrobacter sp.]